VFTFALIVIIGYVIYAMSPEERARALRTALDYLRRAKTEADRRRAAPDAFRDALRERTPRPIATVALAAMSVMVFAGMLVGSGSFSDPATLVSWGGSLATRTTNGEWWRLLMMTFVHAGLLHLIVEVGTIVSLGLVLERLLGTLAFVGVYLAAGLLANLITVSARPLEVAIGGSGAIMGLCGLFIASTAWGFVRRSPFTLPLTTAKIVGPIVGFFVLYSFATDYVQSDSEVVGLIVGVICGAVLSRRADERAAPAPLSGGLVVATLATVIVMALPLRGLADARPEIVRVAAMEDRTAGVYEEAVDKFRKGRITAEALAHVIEQTIVPDLRSTRDHLKALGRVAPEQQPLVADAKHYLELRDESWCVRAAALHKSNSRGLRDADHAERASLEAFEKIRPKTDPQEPKAGG
jgi:rhomboid protease GluP